jgi:hypothetical protein
VQRLVAIPLVLTNAQDQHQQLVYKCINKINNNTIGLQIHKTLIVTTFGCKSAQNEQYGHLLIKPQKKNNTPLGCKCTQKQQLQMKRNKLRKQRI